eukprot:232407_1
MTVFFWTGIAFLIVYRIGSALWVGYWKFYQHDDELYYYDFILIALDLFIFRMVYESAIQAQTAIAENIEIRKRKKQQKDTEKQLEMQVENAKVLSVQPEEQDVEPGDNQMMTQMGESVLESLPQIVLQSVFIIRSGNDDKLNDGNIILIFLSVLASLTSIANKFIYFDKDEVVEEAGSLKPSKEFPGCIQYWYLVCVLWRICSIADNFAIYVLVWTVLGAIWLLIWIVILYIGWIMVMLYAIDDSWIVLTARAFPFLIGQMLDHHCYFQNVAKYIFNGVGLLLIAIFATLSFECGICMDSTLRQFDNETNN